MQVGNYAKYFCEVPAWCAQYEVLAFFLLPMLLILEFYSGLVVRGFGMAVQASKKSFDKPGAMFVINAKDRSFSVTTPIILGLTI